MEVATYFIGITIHLLPIVTKTPWSSQYRHAVIPLEVNRLSLIGVFGCLGISTKLFPHLLHQNFAILPFHFPPWVERLGKPPGRWLGVCEFSIILPQPWTVFFDISIPSNWGWYPCPERRAKGQAMMMTKRASYVLITWRWFTYDNRLESSHVTWWRIDSPHLTNMIQPGNLPDSSQNRDSVHINKSFKTAMLIKPLCLATLPWNDFKGTTLPQINSYSLGKNQVMEI